MAAIKLDAPICRRINLVDPLIAFQQIRIERNLEGVG
jgi:hypothetical protein